jgi:homoprotocatechuate degradation regulator HpaR
MADDLTITAPRMRDFERSIPMMLYRALEVVQPRFRQIFAQFDLTETQWRVLRVLWEIDDRCINDISRLTLIPAPSLVGVIDRLERDGLVQRQRASSDRRQVQVQLTARGKEMHAAVKPLVDDTYDRLEGMLPPARWKALYDTIDALCAAHREAPAQTRTQRDDGDRR